MKPLNATHPLQIYSNVFTSQPDETHAIPHGTLLGEWLTANIPGFDPDNDELTFSLPFDQPVTAPVDCHFVPKKGVVKVLTFGLGSYLLSKMTPKPGGMKTSKRNETQGSEIDLSSASNQAVKYGQPIREAFGRSKIVPDYIVPPRRYFGPDGKTHWIEGLLCVGVGDYDIPASSINVANSPIVGLGGDNYATIYGPGESLAAEPAARWWHTSKEVGPTSTGGSGLALGTVSDATRQAPAGSYLFSGKTITPVSGQTFPTNWETGMYLQIENYRDYQVAGNVLSGDMAGLQVSGGDSVELAGDAIGSRAVTSYTAPTTTNAGTPSVWTAQTAPALSYASEPAQFTVNVGSVTGVVTLNSDYLDEPALIDDINDQLTQTALSGLVSVSAGLMITELPNYAARKITVTGISGAVRVFGSVSQANQNTVIGTARVEAEPAKLTLAGFDYSGSSVRLSINKAGETFVITGVSANLLTVDRVDGLGASTWLGWTTGFTTSSTSLQLDPDTIEGGWVGTFAATPGDELCDRLEFDVFMPQGLIRYDSDGDPHEMPVHVYFRYREGPNDSWKQVSKPFRAQTRDQFGITFSVDLPTPKRVKECQMRRRFAERNKQNIQDKLEWFGLRARMVRKIDTYPDLTTLAFRLDGKSTSAESESQINVIATRKLNGVATRSIGEAVNYIARNTDMDTAAIDALSADWDQRGDYFDFAFNKATTVKAALDTALMAGYAEPTVKSGLISAVRDTKRDPVMLHAYQHTYSAQNTTSEIITQIDMPDQNEVEGLDVEYLDETSWRVETLRCELPGSTGARIEKIECEGITSRTKVYQWGMRQLMSRLLDNVQYSTKTELDARNSEYGDYVNFVQEIPEWSQSAVVESVSGLHVRSTEPLAWVAGEQHVIALQRVDGTMSEVRDATRVDEFTAAIDTPFEMTAIPQETALFFGIKSRFANPAIVRDVRPSGGETSISAIAYSELKYQYDDALPPA
ncbi:hypothetical protein GCM10022421_31900 [Oceanisphaera sediminis]|uniref:Tip attachment protein J HDII-ins2 domain-containing protein n=1 Tax=Oceanisphaera sediminis TaxID=981381 RepID=A0ABP7EMJ7_9GAMM